MNIANTTPVFKKILLLFCLASLPLNVLAEKRIELEKGAIIGNSESPKATYIVPWRTMTPVEIKGLEIGALLDEELAMIKPEVFRRQVELYQIRRSSKQ